MDIRATKSRKLMDSNIKAVDKSHAKDSNAIYSI